MDLQNLKTDEISKLSLVGAESLLREIFPNQADRPSLRWLKRLKANGQVPFVKVGGRVFYDPVNVRSSWGRDLPMGANKNQPSEP